MNNEPKTPDEGAPVAAGAPNPQATVFDDAAEGPGGEPLPRHHDDLIGELRREVADLKDRVLRVHADMDNMRKRTEREKEDTAKFAITRFARDVLTIGDNFHRALGAVPAGAAEADPALKALIEGVTLIEREYINVLERHGVKRLDPQGEPFNPHLHQAVMEMPKPEVAAGTVVQVFQPGYTIDERVLRPAMVVVATGGPKAGAGPAAAAGATDASPADAPPAEDGGPETSGEGAT